MYFVDEKEIVWRKAGVELIILNLANGHYYTLNETGLLIWDGIVNQMPAETIAEKISDGYEIDYASALKDVELCIEQLVREAVIKTQDLEISSGKYPSESLHG